MTEPCIDPDSFDTTDGVIGPHPWLQWRHVETGIVAGNLIDPLTDTAEILVHDLTLAWTNTTPIPQHAYGMCTRDASQVITTANKRFVVEQRRGWASGVAPADPATNMATSRHGGGMDRGLDPAVVFGIWEHRQGRTTTPIGPDVTLAAGETLKVRVALYIVRLAWSADPLPEYVPEIENLIDTGDTELDIFAYPALT
ncbi:DUF7172 family protein [Nocardia sp. CA-290969]|uniref:DUF7172 family protein n=1 Tax=Nocardia sp. CA-290969 TaxID=3239986 RepID=UPI003D8F1E2B